MVIDQIIKFELRSLLGPLTIDVLLQLVIFMSRQKYPRKIFEWIIIYYTKILTKFNPKMQNYKRIFDQIISKSRIETL